MKIISWNVNGIRSAVRKGFFEWLDKESPDILCLQEIKIGEDKLTFDLLYPSGYQAVYKSAERPGYAGIAVFSKKKPDVTKRHLGLRRFDKEGRFLKLNFGDLELINVYIPHGARDKRNMDYKLSAYKKILECINEMWGGRTILVGDFNVAHEEIDLARPKDNMNNTMFTFPERLQIDRVLEAGFVDSFREFNKKGENYSWWPYTYGAYKNNIGWRIDYCFISKKLAPKLESAFIQNRIRMSDHSPIGVVLKL
jgi:exodeoxyribonuclease-3